MKLFQKSIIGDTVVASVLAAGIITIFAPKLAAQPMSEPIRSAAPTIRLNRGDIEQSKEYAIGDKNSKTTIKAKSYADRLEVESITIRREAEYDSGGKSVFCLDDPKAKNTLVFDIESYSPSEVALKSAVERSEIASVIIEDGKPVLDVTRLDGSKDTSNSEWTSKIIEIGKSGTKTSFAIEFTCEFKPPKTLEIGDTLETVFGQLGFVYQHAPSVVEIVLTSLPEASFRYSEIGNWSYIADTTIAHPTIQGDFVIDQYADKTNYGRYIDTVYGNRFYFDPFLTNDEPRTYMQFNVNSPLYKKDILYRFKNLGSISTKGPPSWGSNSGTLVYMVRNRGPQKGTTPLLMKTTNLSTDEVKGYAFEYVLDEKKNIYVVKDSKFNKSVVDYMTGVVKSVEDSNLTQVNDGIGWLLTTEDDGRIVRMKTIEHDSLNDLATVVRPFKLDTVTSVHDNQPVESTLRIYPNPVTDNLTLERERMGQATLVITNNLGQTVYKSLVEAGENNINLPFDSAPGGVYFTRFIYQDGYIEYQKFIKIHK